MDILFAIITVFLYEITEQTLANEVNLLAPKYVKRDNNIPLNCSASTEPMHLSAEFVVDCVTYAKISYHNGHCYYGGSDSCQSNLCSCGNNGNWYSLQIKPYEQKDILSVSCIMVFKTHTNQIKEVEAEASIKIIDMKGPYIHTVQQLPVETESLIDLHCSALGNPDQIKLLFSCLNDSLVNTSNTFNSTSITSTIVLRVTENHNQSCCICKAMIQGYSSSNSIKLSVKESMKIETAMRHSCQLKSTVKMKCIVLNGGGKIISSWIHMINGKIIRTLTPTTNGTISILEIKNCSYDDIGNYTCSIEKAKNTSMFLSVFGVPYVVDNQQMVVRNKKVYMAMKMITSSQLDYVHWYFMTNIVPNDTKNVQLITEKDLVREVYGHTIRYRAIVAQLIINSPDKGIYISEAKNKYGTCHRVFEIKPERAAVDLRDLIWFLSGTAVFLLVSITVAVLTFRCRKEYRNQCCRICFTPSLYHTAPATGDDLRSYDTTDFPHFQTERSSNLQPPLYLDVISGEECESNKDETSVKSERSSAEHEYEEVQ